MAPPCRLIHDRLNASLSWERSIVVDESVDREECASGDEELVEKRTDTSRSSEAILWHCCLHTHEPINLTAATTQSRGPGLGDSQQTLPC